MDAQGIFAAINSHMIEGVMFHDQAAEYFGFLALPSFREEQEKHERAEAKSRQRLVRYYTDHYNCLLPPPDAADPKLIPENWRGHTRHQVDSGTKKRAICEAYVKWRAWECGTRTFYEGYYKELMEQGEAAAACKVMELIRDVDEEIAGLDEEQIMLESMGYDLSVISGEELGKMRR